MTLTAAEKPWRAHLTSFTAYETGPAVLGSHLAASVLVASFCTSSPEGALRLQSCNSPHRHPKQPPRADGKLCMNTLLFTSQGARGRDQPWAGTCRTTLSWPPALFHLMAPLLPLFFVTLPKLTTGCECLSQGLRWREAKPTAKVWEPCLLSQLL